MNNQVSFIPLGGIGDVTKNMYLYEYQNQILIVDCGLGFADETMLGVDLLLPDISYLLKTIKSGSSRIVGMVLTHGHEDHIGALPFILPSLPDFPIYATPLTAAFANEKLTEFGQKPRVKTVRFGESEVAMGDFKTSFIRVTHSIPDTSHVFIQTPVGNFYHGSDFKFDLTPFDGNRTDFAKIAEVAKEGITVLMSDCLGAEKEGYTQSEKMLSENIEQEMRNCKGKFILTTYSSNISRLNQAIIAASKLGRKVCFVGRSLFKASKIAQRLGYMRLDKGMEIQLDELKKYKDSDLLLFVAGSQGQENSALARIVNNEHREIKISLKDTVVFSADPIPGNEVSINSLIDSLSKIGAKVIYSKNSEDFHVSGHGAKQELILLIALTNPKNVLPIGGTFRHIVAYKDLAESQGLLPSEIFLTEEGQEILFDKDKGTFGKKIQLGKVYVDQISEEVVEHFVIRDRQKISKEGVVIIMAEVDSETGQMTETPNIIARGLSQIESRTISRTLEKELIKALRVRHGRVTDWAYIRKRLRETSERSMFKEIRRRPLVLPVVIEV